MKAIAVIISAIIAVSACSSGSDESTHEAQEVVVAADWDGVWGFAINGELNSAFDEIKTYIKDNTIAVMQGDVTLWSGSFNTDMPLEGEYTVISERDTNVQMPYTPADIVSKEFFVKDGSIFYVEDPTHQTDVVEFVKEK